MNDEDRDLGRAERDASPERGQSRIQAPASIQDTHGHISEAVERRGSDLSSILAASNNKPTRRYRRPSNVLSATPTQVERQVLSYLERHPTVVQLMQDHRIQHSYTVGSTRAQARKDIPDFGEGKPYPPPLPEREEYVTEFCGPHDPEHPQNWKQSRKIVIAAILISACFAVNLASSIVAPATQALESEFGVSQEVITLATSLFVLGYGFGPIFWAPMSELYGRKIPTVVSAFLFGIFTISAGISKDIQTFMIVRFWAGFSGSAVISLCPAVFADIYSNEARGVAVGAFSSTVFYGPLMGPMIGGFIVKNESLGWRWTQYIPAILGFAFATLALFFQAESYGPIVLVHKAAELRRITKNWGIHAKQEEIEINVRELLSKNVGRPLRILFTEPIVLVVTIYMSFVYGLLYLSVTAYAIVFSQIHGFGLGVAGLPYFGMVIGVMLGFATLVAMNGSYVRKLHANNNIPVPEWRLYMPMAGGFVFTIGLFWFGWTGYTNTIPWIVPTLAGLAIGFGLFSIFLNLLNYIIDSYLMFAASAVAANTFLRSTFGAVFPMFATYMFDGIGINYGMTLLGCVAALLIPMPFVFYIYGKRIRAKSKFAPARDIQQDKQRDEESRGTSDEKSERSRI